MITCLQIATITEAAAITVISVEVSSNQHIFGVKTVMEHEPKERFDFGSTFGFPNPFDWTLNLNMLEVKAVDP